MRAHNLLQYATYVSVNFPGHEIDVNPGPVDSDRDAPGYPTSSSPNPTQPAGGKEREIQNGGGLAAVNIAHRNTS